MAQETNNTRNLKSLYFATLGVVSMVETQATKTFNQLKKEGEIYDRTLTNRFEDQRRNISEWRESMTERVKTDWKSFLSKDEWEQRFETVKNTIPFTKKTEADATDVAEPATTAEKAERTEEVSGNAA